jgi:hypothetical protein
MTPTTTNELIAQRAQLDHQIHHLTMAEKRKAVRTIKALIVAHNIQPQTFLKLAAKQNKE